MSTFEALSKRQHSSAAEFAQEVLSSRVCSRMSSFYAARSSGGHERSGATEHARPLQRLACDGNSYTEDEFAEWYGEEYRDMWDSASGITMSIPSGQGPQAGAIEHSAPATQCLDEFDPWKAYLASHAKYCVARERFERGYLRSQAQLKVLCPGDAELAHLCPGSQCRVDVADIGGQHVFTIQCLEDMTVASVAATWLLTPSLAVHGQLVPPGGVRAATTMGDSVAAQQQYALVRPGGLQESQ